MELKPCPMCGTEIGCLSNVYDSDDNPNGCMVKCDNCGLSTAAFYGDTDEYAATLAWNTRHKECKCHE